MVLASDITVPGNSFPQIAVAPTGQLVFATGGASGARVRFARVRRDGTSTIVDSTWVGQAREIAVSPDGVHAAAVVNRGTWDIQERDLRTGALSYVSIPATVATDPVFSSDGQWLFFIAGGPEGGKLYQVALGSTAAPRLVLADVAANFNEPAPSPDGRAVYYVAGLGGQADIYVQALDQPGSSGRAVLATPAREKSPRPSPDGRWLAYVSDESGTSEVYVRSTEASRAERWQVSASGGRVPRWARNGRELFFLTRDSMMVAEVSSGVQFGVGARRSLFSIARFSGDTYDVLPGDAGFLMLQPESGAARKNQIVFVDRWTTLLAAAKARR
jgi:Tol biopolymer transport system component